MNAKLDTTAIRKAVEAMGSQTALAEAIGVSQGLVWQWCNGRLRVPAERCAGIERATEGKVTRQMLRPDLFEKPEAA